MRVKLKEGDEIDARFIKELGIKKAGKMYKVYCNFGLIENCETQEAAQKKFCEMINAFGVRRSKKYYNRRKD